MDDSLAERLAGGSDNYRVLSEHGFDKPYDVCAETRAILLTHRAKLRELQQASVYADVRGFDIDQALRELGRRPSQ
jgi:hypothetical protein